MSNIPTLYGFDGSTYVRTVRSVLATKGADYHQVPVNVMEGEPRMPEHLERHPFGKVPVLDHDGMRIIETSAITRYLDEVLPGPSVIADNPRDRARMNMAIGIYDAYGYAALLGVAGYHLFPDLIGGKNEDARSGAIESSRLVLTQIMKIRSDSRFIAGDRCGLADFYLGPVCFYVSLTDDADTVFDVPGFSQWWDNIQAAEEFKSTEPDLG